MEQAEGSSSGTSMKNPLKIGALLIDLNGTLHTGSTPTPRAVEAMRKLRRSQIPFIFCSNSTKESTRSLLRNLQEMGFEATEKELLTSLGACRALVEQRGLKPFLLLSSSAKEEFAQVTVKDDDYDSVILGLDPPSLSYDPLNVAFRILKNEPIAKTPTFASTSAEKTISLIAPHAALYQQSSETEDLPMGLSLGIGPFVKALETASGVEAELVGKPTKRFFELAIQRLCENSGWNGDAGSVGIIGDDVKNDLGKGAKELGLKRVLMRTGKYREGVDEGEGLDGVYDNFADFIDDIVE